MKIAFKNLDQEKPDWLVHPGGDYVLQNGVLWRWTRCCVRLASSYVQFDDDGFNRDEDPGPTHMDPIAWQRVDGKWVVRDDPNEIYEKVVFYG